MLGRRRIDTPAPIRSSLSHAAFAVEERVLWGGADVLRGLVDVVKWPFERAIWAIERGLVWPLEERTGDWGRPLHSAGVAAVALLAVGAGVLGLLWASGSGGTAAPQAQSASVSLGTPTAVQAVKEQAVAPVLHGTAPDFKHASSGLSAAGTSAPKAGGEATGSAVAGTTETSTAASTASIASSSSTTARVAPAGPPATKVAHRFAGAFVLYETGQNDRAVRTAFAATATPQLTRELLRRPPRLPANVKVPKAKVLNIVPGPRHGDTYTLSVSLLRVGVTSELRLEMQRNAKSGELQVARVLG
ncbi:MAG TPA: hypothetical protein VHU14_07600 [Solirubrobacterales bacterium]|jgi:hypothetical protein|nr:hypothetical protein [Solirubrobacterales bacterium]